MTADSQNMRSKLERTATPGVYRRGPRYVAVYRRGGRQRKRTFDSYAEARRVKAAYDAMKPLAGPDVTFEVHATRWVEAERLRGRLRRSTLSDYERRLATWVIPRIGSRRLSGLRRADLAAMICELGGETGSRGRPLSDASIKTIVATLRVCLAAAVDDGLLEANPAAGLRVRSRRDRVKYQVFSESELGRLLKSMPARDRLLFEVLAATGLRISEALGLQWHDLLVSPTGGSLSIERGWVRGAVHPPKTAHGYRCVPIGRELLSALETRRSCAVHAGANDFVFASRSGRPLDPSNLRRRVLDPAARSCGLRRVSFHDFRHLVGSRVFERHDARVAQAWLGHHSAAFTLSTYVHLHDAHELEPLPELQIGEGCGTPTNRHGSGHVLRNTRHIS